MHDCICGRIGTRTRTRTRNSSSDLEFLWAARLFASGMIVFALDPPIITQTATAMIGKICILAPDYKRYDKLFTRPKAFGVAEWYAF